MDPELFGRRLKELREQAGLSQTALAEAAGLSQSAIAHWERGRSEPIWSNVLALATALGVDCLAFQQPAATKKAGGRKKKGSDESSSHQ
jgi:transcriptional regulator with XRE-family HTH domain